MSCNNHTYCDRAVGPNQPEINQNALRALHERLEARKAEFRVLFPTPPPGEVRRYVIPTEMKVGGCEVRKPVCVVVWAPDAPDKFTPDIVKTEFITGKELRIDDQEVDLFSEPHKEKSILDTMIRFRDVLDIKAISVRNLLHWMSMEWVEFAHLEYTQPHMEFDNLQCFKDWVQGMLEILREGTSDANNEEDEKNETSSIRSARSSSSWVTIPIDQSQNETILSSTESAVEADTLPENLEILEMGDLTRLTGYRRICFGRGW